MKSKRILLGITSLALVAIFSLTSCEKDESLVSSQEADLQFETGEVENPDFINTISKQSEASRMAFVNRNIQRYYSGGSNTVHTYKYSNLGIGIGSYEGISFNAPVAAVGTPFNSSAYSIGFFLLHPQNKDFVITVNASEINRLINRGWRNLTFKRILIKKTGGGGTVPLYRFYNAQNSDHLFTKSYSEGANASGYNYEGVVGYVK